MVLLLAMNMLNYVDRYVLAAVEPTVQRQLLPDDPHAQAKMGLLFTAFLVSYMVAAPLFGWLAERRSRWLLIAVGVALWSLASGASGLAVTFAVLLATRCLVGVGEAAYGPAAPAIISDFYPLAWRGKVLSWFYIAIPVGSALGYVLGGYMAALNPAAESWRWAFYLVVVPGLLLALCALWMGEPRRGAAEGLAPQPPRHVRWNDYLTLLRTPSYVLDTLGMTAMTFAVGALAVWMPRYLESHRVGLVLGFHPVAFLGILSAVAGISGTLAGGIAGDACRGRWPGAYFLVSGAGLLACAPCALAFLAVPFPAAWLFIFLAEFFLFFNTGPTNTILANVTHPALRTTAFGLNIFIIHSFGDVISPPLVGAVADSYNLTVGFVAVSLFMLLGGVFWLWGARYLEADTAAVAQPAPPAPATQSRGFPPDP
jgi:MFS family permease